MIAHPWSEHVCQLISGEIPSKLVLFWASFDGISPWPKAMQPIGLFAVKRSNVLRTKYKRAGVLL